MPSIHPPVTQLSHAEAAELAAELARPGPAMRIFGEAAQMENRARLAARLIQAMLRQSHSSDVFQLPPEDARHGSE